jgi:uncharacterized membrane protein YedE/YeeE
LKSNVIALLSGTLFGLGLAISHMINPAKVLAFLDVAGHWDPSLALVMGSALAVMALAWHWKRRDSDIRRDDLNRIDAPLVIGAALFGTGWGLVGYCPGPAISALAILSLKPLIFVAAMIAGMAIFQVFPSRGE